MEKETKVSENALQIVENQQLAVRVNPMDALALMTDNEFRRRLDALKVAQHRMETIQRELMKPDVDYGVIPGTGQKPTLLKSGAEKLCKFHRLVPTFDQQTIIGDGVTQPHIRVLTVCSLHAETEDGPIVGQGLGACNSWEKKYRYRDAQRKCPMCGQATIFKSKKDDGWFCWAKKGGCGATFRGDDRAIGDQMQGQIDNPDPYDVENTLEKMSAKRAYVDATLRATATSGLFSQDLEDVELDAPAKANNAEAIPVDRQQPKAPPHRPTPPAPAKVVDEQQRVPWDENEAPAHAQPVNRKLPEAVEPEVHTGIIYAHNALCPKDCDSRLWQRWCNIVADAEAAKIPLWEFEPMDTAAVLYMGKQVRARLDTLKASQEYEVEAEAELAGRGKLTQGATA